MNSIFPLRAYICCILWGLTCSLILSATSLIESYPLRKFVIYTILTVVIPGGFFFFLVAP